MFAHITENASVQTISHWFSQSPMEANFYRHFHENYELLLVISGDVHYNIDGTYYKLNPYDLLLIPASVYHFLVPISNQTYENYVINIRCNFANPERLRRLFSSPKIINIGSDSVLRKMFQRFDHYYELYSVADFEEASGYLVNEILLYISYKDKNNMADLPVIQSHPLISQITSFIAANLQSELNSETVAKHLKFSKSYVQNAFSAAMGIGLQQYINRKKIYAAHGDIQNGMSAYEVAEKYCYHDYSSFYRQYKKTFGHSPKYSKP